MLAALPFALLARPAFGAGPEIYVSAEDGGDIAVVDPERGEVVARIAVGKRPRGLKISRDGKLLYVALSGSPKAAPGVDESKLPAADRAADGVGVVDLATRKLLRVLKSGQDPESFDLSADGKTLFVSNEETAEMTVLDLVTGKVTRRVPIGKEPEGVTVSPDGRAVWVTSEEESVVVAIDTETLLVLKRVPTGPRPRSIVFSRDGTAAFVTDEFGARVTVIDAVKYRPAGDIKIVAKAKTVLGPRPMGAVLSPDGKHVYVSNGRGESVAVIDVGKRKLVKMIDGVGARPWGIGVSADGKQIFTANGPSNDVSIIDAASGRVAKRVKVDGVPWGLVVAPAVAGEAGAAAPADTGRPVCVRVGTRSEGWAWPSGRFIHWAKCKGSTPVCETAGKEGEGWYARGSLIALDACAGSGSRRR